MSGGTVFPQAKMLLENGEISSPWRFWFQNLYIATGGGSPNVPASRVTVTPTGSITTPDAQSALAGLDASKVPITRTVNGHPLSADVTVTAANVGAPSGSGTSSGTNTGDQTITLSGDATGSGTAGVAVTVSKIGGKAVSLAGSLTTAGAFASTFTMTGVTTVTFPTSGTLATVDGNIGAATGTSLAVTGALTSSGTAGIGYATGAGGTVTQATSKATGVTLNKLCGEITMNAAALGAGGVVSFTLTNSTIATKDIIHVDIVAGFAAFFSYSVAALAGAPGTASVVVKNTTAGSLSEALVLRYVVTKAVTA